jgi:hypothetical protein
MLMVLINEVWSLWFSLSYANQDFCAYNAQFYVLILFACLPSCLSTCLPDCQSVCVSVCLTICLSFRLSVCMSVFLSVFLSVCLSVSLSACLSVFLFFFLFSVFLSVYLSVFLPVCLIVCLPFWVSSLDLQVHISFYQLLMSMWGYCGIPFRIDARLCIDLKVRVKESQGGSRTVIYGVTYTVIRKNTVRWRKKVANSISSY